jgi:hypothetical protein
MAAQLTTTQYSNLNDELAQIFSANQYPYINIYTDAAGTSYATDSNGNHIAGKKVNSVSLTAPYLDPATNTMTQPSTSFSFTDGSVFTCVDNVNSNWYSVYGVPVPPRKF